MSVRNYNQTMSIDEYLRNFHGTGGNRIWGGQPATEAEPWNRQFQSNIVGYTPGTDINQWAAANGGDINRILADGRGVYSGRFGDETANLDQWVPKYDPQTGQVTFQVQEGGDEFGNLAMMGALGFLGAAIPGFGLNSLLNNGVNTSGFGNPEMFNLVDQTGSNLTGGLEHLTDFGTLNSPYQTNLDGWTPNADTNWAADLHNVNNNVSNVNDLIGGTNDVVANTLPDSTNPWNELDQMIEKLGTNAGELENLGTATSVTETNSWLQNLLGGRGSDLVNTLSRIPGLSSLFNTNNTNTGSGTDTIKDLIGSILGYTTSNDNAERIEEMMRYAIDMSDPFRSQRGQYQTRLADLYANPNSFFETGAAAQAAEGAARYSAAHGYNQTPNQNMNVANSLFASRDTEIGRLSHLAGAQFSPAGAGDIITNMTPQITGATNSANGNLGFGLNAGFNFLNSMYGGNSSNSNNNNNSNWNWTSPGGP